MIIVFGKGSLAPHHREQAHALAQEHVLRPRAELGCSAHDWHEDPGCPGDLVFVEE